MLVCCMCKSVGCASRKGGIWGWDTKVLAGSVRGKGVGRREYGSPTSRKQIEDKTRTSKVMRMFDGKGEMVGVPVWD